MAFSTNSVFEVRSTGDNLNSGGFNSAGSSPGTDRTQQDAAHVVIDGVTITATVHTTTTQLTLVGYTVVAADNRNTVKIVAGGTSSVTGFYEITAVDTVNNRWTMSSSMGTAGQTIVGRMGGGWADLSQCVSGTMPANFFVYVKEATYTITGITLDAPGGGEAHIYYGYSTTRGDRGRPTIRITANRTTVWFVNDFLYDFILDLNGFNQTSAQVCNAMYVASRVSIINGGAGTNVTLLSLAGTWACARNCYVEKTTSIGINNSPFAGVYNCVAKNCGQGFTGDVNGRTFFTGCIAISCTTAGFRTDSTNGEYKALNCTAVSCGIGFDAASGSAIFEKCLAVNSTTYGFNFASVGTSINNAAYNSGTANVNGTPNRYNTGFINLTSDPFNDTAGADYSLNNTAGGGAELKDLTLDGFTSLATTPAFEYIGAVSPELGGGGGNVGLVGGILGS